MDKTIWHELEPDNIFKAVEGALGERLSNLLLKRNSYVNRVYELEKHDPAERVIVKFYRPHRWSSEMIIEEHKFLEELSAKENPVIAPLKVKGRTLFTFKDIPFALFPKRGGRAMDEFDEETWKILGRLIARLHLVGEKHKRSKRITWRPTSATKHHLEGLAKTDYVLPDFKKAFFDAAEAFIKKAEPLFGKQEFILLHGDLHKGNLIHRPGEGIYFIDFDDIALGPPVQDIWMLLPDKPENCKRELGLLLDSYETFRRFDKKSLDLVPILRGMRIIHFVYWLAMQSGEPDFHNHFPEAGTKKYWNEVTRDLQGII